MQRLQFNLRDWQGCLFVCFSVRPVSGTRATNITLGLKLINYMYNLLNSGFINVYQDLIYSSTFGE